MQGEVEFRQSPKLEDCFPSSAKQYKEVLHEETGEVLQVRSIGVRTSTTVRITIVALFTFEYF